MKLPTKRDYDRFVEKFGEGVSKESPDVCFYLYGSYVDGECAYGSSDIDGGLILNSQFVTDKEKVLNLSKILKENLKVYGVKTQFNLLDRGTCKDGRFLSYPKNYTDWIKNSGRVVCGPDYRQEMNGLNYKFNTVEGVGFNLRFIRNGLLESIYDLSSGNGNFKKNLDKAIRALSSLPKKIIYIKKNEIIQSCPESIKEISNIFHDLDLSTLEKIDGLLKNPKQFMAVTHEQNFLFQIELYKEILTSYEEMIKAYVEKFPDVSEREVRS